MLYLLQKCGVVETSHSHSIIDGTGIEITLWELSVLWNSNTEIFIFICLRNLLLAKTSFIPSSSGFEGHFAWNLLPSFHMCFLSFVYHLQASRARPVTKLWQMLKEIQKASTISPSHRPNILKLLNSRAICSCYLQSNLNQSYPLKKNTKGSWMLVSLLTQQACILAINSNSKSYLSIWQLLQLALWHQGDTQFYSWEWQDTFNRRNNR